MNAKKTLARLNKELHDTAAALHEESSIKNFRVFLGEITLETERQYNFVRQHNNTQQAKVSMLRNRLFDIQKRILDIKDMRPLVKLFIA